MGRYMLKLITLNPAIISINFSDFLLFFKKGLNNLKITPSADYPNSNQN